MFEAFSLSLRYDSSNPLFSGLSFRLQPGDCLWVKGANGCGKTSLLYALANVIPQHIEAEKTGNILLNGKITNDIHIQNLLPDIGLVMHNPAWQLFFPTVKEELIYSLENLGWDETEITKRITDSIHRFDLTAYAEANPLTLSAGIQKLLTLAIIDSVSPFVIMLDEPLNGLSGANLILVKDWMKAQSSLGKILLIAEHNPLIAEVCNRVLEFHPDGRVCE